jgi:predicted PurR-regulated permease PerM
MERKTLQETQETKPDGKREAPHGWSGAVRGADGVFRRSLPIQDRTEGVCFNMEDAHIPAVAVAFESTDTVEPSSSAVEASLVTLPATRPAVDARGLALGVLAALASVYALWWTRAFAIPLLLGIVISYTLYPLVAWLEAIRIPRVVGTAIVMVSMMSALAFGMYSLRGQMQTIIGQLPEAATKLSAGLADMRIGQIGSMQKMQSAATQVEKAATQAAGGPTAPRQAATHVIVDQPNFKWRTFLWESSMDTLGALSQAAMVTFLVFFLLLGGDKFKRNLVRLTGPSLSRKKITVHILNDINHSIQKYLLMLFTTNLLVGLLTWIVLRWLGLENAGAWAAAAGLLHIVPYLGPVVIAVATAMAAFIQFNSLAMALLVAGASLAIATVIGTFVTTWMTGRIANLNSAAVFISLMFWGWLWGIWGMLLSIPIIVIVKVVSQHVEQLHPIAELLGDS